MRAALFAFLVLFSHAAHAQHVPSPPGRPAVGQAPSGQAPSGQARPGPQTPPLLDVRAVPADEAGRQSYAAFLMLNLPRSFAVGAGGRAAGAGGATLEQARERALALCQERGGTDCRPYAENLSLVWPGRAYTAPAPPGPLLSSINDDFVPDPRHLWYGPQAARGVYVWSHGRGTGDSRGQQPPAHVRAFNLAGFDVVRFDRHPNSDDRDRASGWLRDGLAELRRLGYRMVVAGGQSRGAWNSVQMLDTPGLVDAVIAVAAAAHGMGGSTNLTAQWDDMRSMIADVPPGRARLAFVQFGGDMYMGDLDARLRLLERLRPRLGALLVIDRPEGLLGHGAGSTPEFARRFGPCLLRFALDPAPPQTCQSAPPP